MNFAEGGVKIFHFKKEIAFHCSCHTFATTVLLTNDVPMETTMELLGHTDIRTTQIYGKIVQKKISKDMELLRAKMAQDASQLQQISTSP
ncbi:MAG: tyrosine-type recombinase/integrase [Cyclobacteriaceae bacterium]|nr:tyrosine-type recombinase/integrase [Cyclobacteriaceae bacterium]